MGSMAFSLIGMFSPTGVEVMALAVCVVLVVVSTRAVKKDAAAQKRRKEARRRRRQRTGPEERGRDQLDVLYQAGILTREEYEEQKNKTRRKHG